LSARANQATNLCGCGYGQMMTAGLGSRQLKLSQEQGQKVRCVGPPLNI